MTSILRRLPFLEREDEVQVGLQRVPIKPYQIILWASVTPRAILELPPLARRFPVILDTAHNHNFSISESQLAEWGGVQVASLAPRAWIRERGRHVPLYAA